VTMSPFSSSPPLVFATARLPQDAQRVAYVVSVDSIATTSSSVVVNLTVAPAVNQTGWGPEPITLNWIALDSAVPPSSDLYINSLPLPSTSLSSPLSLLAPLPPQFRRSDPSVLAIVRRTSSQPTPSLVVAVSSAGVVTNNDTMSLTLNVAPAWANSSASLSHLAVDFVAFSRYTLRRPLASAVQTSLVTGPLATTLEQIYRPGYAQITRVINSSKLPLSGDVDVLQTRVDATQTEQGEEVVVSVLSSLNGECLFTDSNALEIQRRCPQPNATEPIAGNFWPAVSMVAYNDTSGATLSVFGDRSHGAGMVAPGRFEVMLNRRCLADDGYGVGEILNDSSPVFSSFVMALSPNRTIAAAHRHAVGIRHDVGVVTTATKVTDRAGWTKAMSTWFSALASPLPPQIHLLDWQLVDAAGRDNRTLLRLQNVFEIWESDVTVDVDLGRLFKPEVLTVSSVQRVTLSANQPVEEVKRLAWRVHGEAPPRHSFELPKQDIMGPPFIVSLRPRDIVTVVIN